MKFRSKPTTIEAEQWLPGKNVPGVEMHDREGVGPHPVVTTTHGQLTRVSPGDWIIREPDGNGYYPCKPDIFVVRYEPVGNLTPLEADNARLRTILARIVALTDAGSAEFRERFQGSLPCKPTDPFPGWCVVEAIREVALDGQS